MPANEMVLTGGVPRLVQLALPNAVKVGEVQSVLGKPGAGGVLVPMQDLAANVVGNYAIEGGIYEMIGERVMNFGQEIYFDADERKGTTVSSGNHRVGYAFSACAGDGSTFLVYHLAE